MSESKPPSRRGFASLNAEQRRAISSLGGKAAHERGTAHRFSGDAARSAGRKGGRKISADRVHMSEIGKKGGLNQKTKLRANATSAADSTNSDEAAE